MAWTYARKAKQGTSLPVVLRDGQPAFLSSGAPVDAGDVQSLCDATGLAPQQRATLLMAARSPQQVEPGAAPAHGHVAAHEPTGTLIGLGTYVTETDADARACCAVDPAHRGLGLGTTLLRHLADSARPHGVARFLADLPRAGRAEAMDFLLDSGFRSSWDVGGELLAVELELGARRPGWSTPDCELGR